MRSRFKTVVRYLFRRKRFVITRQIHQNLTANGGYYSYHPDRVWYWVKDKPKATQFYSVEQATICAKGCDLSRFADYKIERM